MEHDDGWTPIDGAGEQVDRLAIADLDRLAELTHPVRGVILRRLHQPRSVAELAEQLDVPVTRLYHHVNRLLDAGLIEAVATRQVAAVTERRYRAVASSFGVHEELVRSADRSKVSAALGSLFDVAKIDFQRHVESEGFGPTHGDADRPSLLSLSELHLTEDRRRELKRRLTDLIIEFAADDEDEPGATATQLFVVVNPDAT